MGTEYLEYLANVLETVSYIIVTLGAIALGIQRFTNYNPFSKLRDWALGPIKTDLKALHDRLDKLDDRILKMMICSDGIPLSERVIAGDIYVNERHLNGDIKIKYKLLKETYEKELKNKQGGKL